MSMTLQAGGEPDLLNFQNLVNLYLAKIKNLDLANLPILK